MNKRGDLKVNVGEKGNARRCMQRPDPSREYCVRGRRESEVMFELRSKDPRDLLQVIWTKTKGITAIDVAAEEIHGDQRTVSDSATVNRSPQLFDRLVAITARWSGSDSATLPEDHLA
jgi:hypothetical protein